MCQFLPIVNDSYGSILLKKSVSEMAKRRTGESACLARYNLKSGSRTFAGSKDFNLKRILVCCGNRG